MFDEFPEDERPFLEAIAESPDDLDARRVYADWLDDHGDPRGEFLRLDYQVEDARRTIEDCRRRLRDLLGIVDPEWVAQIRMKYDLVLHSCTQRIEAMSLVRFRWNLSLTEAKELVESAPVILARNAPYEEAMRVAESFSGIADVRLVPTDYLP